ncbi:MAG: Hpt domain-containing protein [Spirochaetales bacterium]
MKEQPPLLNQQHIDMISDLVTEDGRNLAWELLEHVSGDGVDSFESLSTAIEQGNIDSARGLAHRLKGMTSNLGMTRLHYRFRDTEDRAKNGTNPPLTRAEIEELRSLLHESIEAFRAYAKSLEDTP